VKPDTAHPKDKQSSGAKREMMRVKLYSPFQTYFNGDAYSISGENKTGPFDILPRHHSFMTLLDAGELFIKSPEGDLKVKISRGIMHVKENQTIVFLDV
jgi:F0F1-type ATP synthase epsilon subunit